MEYGFDSLNGNALIIVGLNVLVCLLLFACWFLATYGFGCGLDVSWDSFAPDFINSLL